MSTKMGLPITYRRILLGRLRYKTRVMRLARSPCHKLGCCMRLRCPKAPTQAREGCPTQRVTLEGRTKGKYSPATQEVASWGDLLNMTNKRQATPTRDDLLKGNGLTNASNHDLIGVDGLVDIERIPFPNVPPATQGDLTDVDTTLLKDLRNACASGSYKQAFDWAKDKLDNGMEPQQLRQLLRVLSQYIRVGIENEMTEQQVAHVLALHYLADTPMGRAYLRTTDGCADSEDQALRHALAQLLPIATGAEQPQSAMQRIYGKYADYLEGFVEGLELVGKHALMIDWLFDKLKPSALVRILSTLDGFDVPGFWAILELYGLAYKLPTDLFSTLYTFLCALVRKLAELVAQLGQNAHRLVNLLPRCLRVGPLAHFANVTLEGPDDQPIETLPWVGALLVAFCAVTGLCTQGQALQHLRNFSLTVGTFSALLALFKSIHQWVQRRHLTDAVDALTSRALAVIMQARSPSMTTNDVDRMNLSQHMQELANECTTRLADPTYAPYIGSLRTTLEALNSTMQQMNSSLAATAKRTPPKVVILAGPAGAGKTQLAHHLAECYHRAVNYAGPPAHFSLMLDHHDSYSGAPAAIWDEFDVDQKGAFVETIIAMASGVSLPLNCDLPQNKGRIFTSELVICTTNSETPLPVNSPRATPFYRRLEIYDVTNPTLSNHLARCPGVAPPDNIYKSDFSHLLITRRPYLGYNATGDTLTGHAAPTFLTITELVRRLTSNKLQGRRGNRPAPINTKLAPNSNKEVGVSGQPSQARQGWVEDHHLVQGPWTRENTPPLLNTMTPQADIPDIDDMPELESDSDYDTPDTLPPRPPTPARASTPQQALDTVTLVAPTLSAKTVVISCKHLEVCLAIIDKHRFLTRAMYNVEMGWSNTAAHSLAKFATRDTHTVVLVPMGHNVHHRRPDTYAHATRVPDDHEIVSDLSRALALTTSVDVATLVHQVATNRIMVGTGPGYYPVDPKVVETCDKSNPQLAAELAHHFKVTNLPLAITLIKHLIYWEPNLAVDCLKKFTFSTTPSLTILKTSTCDIEIYTCGGAIIRRTGSTHHAASPTNHSSAHQRGWLHWLARVARAVATIIYRDFTSAMGIVALTSNLTRMQTQGRSRRRGTARGIVLSDEDYEAWQDARRDLRRDITVEDYIKHARDGYEEDATLGSYLRLRSMRKSAGAWNTLEGNALLKGPSPTVPVVDEDELVQGYLNHLGNGLYVGLKHTLPSGLPPHDFSLILTMGDLAFLTGPDDRPYYSVSDQQPANFRNSTLSMVMQGTWVHGEVEISGYSYIPTPLRQTQPGDCGTPVLATDGSLVALHAGSIGGVRKYGQVVTRAMVQHAKRVAARGQQQWRGVSVSPSDQPQGPLPELTRYQRAIEDEGPAQPALAGAGDSRQGPSQITLLTDGLKPFAVEKAHIDANILARAKCMVHRELATICADLDTTPLGFEEAFHTMNMNSSCGPFVGGKKRDHLTEEGKLKPECTLRSYLQSCWDQLAIGRPLRHAYKLGLKDEMLPNHKIMNKKRLLWAADVAITHAMASVFYNIFKRFKDTAPYTGLAPGMDPDTKESLQVLKTRANNKHMVAGDYRKWDSTVPRPLLGAALEVLFNLATDTPFSRALHRTLLAAPIGYVMDVTFTAQRGLPSGIPGTSFLNSVIHLILHKYCILKAHQDLKLGSPANLDAYDIITYGDDFICFWPLNAKGLEGAYANVVSQLGMELTAPSKAPFGTLEDITFLKRTYCTWERDHYEWVDRPRLDADSIVRQFHFVRGKYKPDPMVLKPIQDEARVAQLTLALALASNHGEALHDHCVKLWNKQIDAPAPTFEESYSWATTLFDVGGDPTILALLDDVVTFDAKETLEGRNQPESDNKNHSVLTRDVNTAHMNTGERQNASGAGSTTPAQQNNTNTCVADPTVQEGTCPGLELQPSAAPPTAASALALSATGVTSNLDPFILNNFTLASRVPWRTTTAPGTILTTGALGPLLNPYTAYLQSIYGGWSGGMEIQLVISGAGAFGGVLNVSVVPPGNTIAGSTLGTGFPHTLVDVRHQAGYTFMLPDINSRTFHQIPADSQDQTTRFVVTVLTPLINPFGTATSSPYSSAAELLIFTRPAADFMFHLLVPPRTPITNALSSLITDPTKWLGNRFGVPVSRLRFTNTQTQQWNVFAPGGTTPGWGTGDPRIQVRVRFEKAQQWVEQSANKVYMLASAVGPTVVSGIPPGYPDIIPTSGQALNNTNKQLGAEGMATFTDTYGNWKTLCLQCTYFTATSTTADGANDGTIPVPVAYIRPDQPVGFIFENYMTKPGSGAQTFADLQGAIINTIGLITTNNSTSGLYDKCLQLNTNNLQYTAPADYMYVNLVEHVTNYNHNSSQVGGWDIYSAQPVQLSTALRYTTTQLDGGKMMQFTMSSAKTGESWDLGILSDGRMVTGPVTANSTYSIPSDLTMTYLGVTNVGAVLRAPTGVSAAAARVAPTPQLLASGNVEATCDQFNGLAC
uniref:Genome polyprotein n=1 Tax=Caliciviridae sp. TaxID=1916234 RepID=A0A6M9Z7N1_9CALI|nr:MAG: polyprotein [Caliciviridae sp.]